jgi:hypothetical protein
MMRHQRSAWLSLAFCLVLGAEVSAQQPSFAVLFQSAEVNLRENAAKIELWRQAAQQSWLIVIIVGLLGILTAALQAVRFRYKALATALVGGLVSGATVYSAATIPADYKTLNNLVASGTRLVNSAKTWLENGRNADNDDDRQFALNEIEKRLAALALLGVPESSGGSGTSARSGGGSASRTLRLPFNGFVAVAHAQERQAPAAPGCGCFSRMPKQQQQQRQVAMDIIGCGTAAGSSLQDAHDRAVYEAAKSIAAQLRSRMKVTLTDQQLVDYVRRVATEYDSCPASGKKTEISVLLRLPDSFGRDQAVKAFASRSGLPARLKVPSLRVVEDGSAGDTAWTFDILVDGRLVTRIPAREYSDRAATRIVNLSGADAVEAPVEMPKSNYWLVEIKGRRTNAPDTAIGARAIGDINRPVEIPVTNPEIRNGSFVFTVSFAKS